MLPLLEGTRRVEEALGYREGTRQRQPPQSAQLSMQLDEVRVPAVGGDLVRTICCRCEGDDPVDDMPLHVVKVGHTRRDARRHEHVLMLRPRRPPHVESRRAHRRRREAHAQRWQTADHMVAQLS